MRVKPNLSEIVELYIDESSQNNHRYLVIGAICVSTSDSEQLNELLLAARGPELANPASEAKWVKVSLAKLPAYLRLVDVLFDNAKLVHFHSLFVDTSAQDHKRWNQGSRDVGFNKEIYQLAINCSRLYGKEVFHVYPDRRNTPQPPEELRLNPQSRRRQEGR